MRGAATGSDEAGFCPAIGCHQRRQKAWHRVLLRAARAVIAWVHGLGLNFMWGIDFQYPLPLPLSRRGQGGGIVSWAILAPVRDIVQPQGEGRA